MLKKRRTAAGPVDRGRLVEGGGDVPEGREVEDHVVAQALPHGHEHRGEQQHRAVGEEGDGLGDEAQFQEDRVDEAVAAQQPLPDQADHHRRGDHRGVEGGAEEADARDLRLHEDREGQREQHQAGDDDQEVEHAVAGRDPEVRVGQGASVVVEADEGAAAQDPGVGEREDDGVDERPDAEDRDHHQAGGEEEVGGPPGPVGQPRPVPRRRPSCLAHFAAASASSALAASCALRTAVRASCSPLMAFCISRTTASPT